MDLEEFYQYTEEEAQNVFNELAGQVEQLGYKPKRAKTKDINYVFFNTKTKKNLLKFSIEKGIPVLKMKFFATKSYSRFFQECIRQTIEEFDFRYTGCYNCGRCKEELAGYEYTYEDGRRYFRCGSEFVSVPGISASELHEAVKLLKAQHEFYLLSGDKLNASK